MTKFNLALFRQLNAEYSAKRLVPQLSRYDKEALFLRGAARAAKLARYFDLSTSKRILEIGCGRGEVLSALASQYNADAVGVDLVSYPEWSDRGDATFHCIDLIADDAPDIGAFDIIYSHAVWEHVRHPFAMLKKSFELLRPGGFMYLTANLYRGPSASHCYREVFFPWPHLLFQDDVFNDFYMGIGKPWKSCAWVNKLTAAEYHVYFQDVGFETKRVTYRMIPLDEGLYVRFLDVFERYPRLDLQRDFIEAQLVKP